MKHVIGVSILKRCLDMHKWLHCETWMVAVLVLGSCSARLQEHSSAHSSCNNPTVQPFSVALGNGECSSMNVPEDSRCFIIGLMCYEVLLTLRFASMSDSVQYSPFSRLKQQRCYFFLTVRFP